MARIALLDLVEEVFQKMQTADKSGRRDAGDGPEYCVKAENDGRGDIDADRRQMWDREGRLRPEEEPPDESRGAGRQRYRQEGADADLGHHQLDREHDAADRGIKSRSDASAGTSGDEDDPLPGRHSHDLAQGGAKGRADLDDRALASDRRTAADSNRRGQRLDDGNDRPDYPSLIIDRIHDLRYPVPAGLGCESRDEEGDRHGADRRYQDDECTPGARRREKICVGAHRQMA